MDINDSDLVRHIHREIIDGFDEELELEFGDVDIDPATGKRAERYSEAEKTERGRYFRELFRLQAELVKLQDWVVATKHKVVALPAPSDRERTQWYFQRYAPHLPAGGEIVLFDRSWEEYTRAKEIMLERTHIPEAPWWVVPYVEVERPTVVMLARERHDDYRRRPRCTRLRARPSPTSTTRPIR